MSANRNKQKQQNQQLHSSLDYAEQIREARERQKAFYLKVSDFLLDLAKLVFGGIILTGIIDLNLNKVWLFSVGAIVAAALASWGFNIYKRGMKIKWDNNMEFIIFLAIIGVIAIIGNIWTLIGIKQDERNGLHKPISQ